MGTVNLLTRRRFLNGIGGAAIAAPLLPSVPQRSAVAQTVGTEAPKRLIMMFTHYGCLTDRWFPLKAHGELNASDYAETSLDVLAPYADKLLMPRGVRAMNEWNSTASRGQGNDSHTQVVGTYFTCQPVTPNADDPFSFETETKFNAKPVGPSLDHVCAQQLSQDGLPLVMRVAGSNETPQSAVSYQAAETIFPGDGGLSQVYDRILGLVSPEASTAAVPYASARRSNVLDLIRDDLRTLQGYPLSAADRAKLEAWESLIADSGNAVASVGCAQADVDALGIDATSLSSGGSLSINISEKIGDTDLDLADVWSNVAVLSALCNYNPVALLKYPGNYVLRGLGLQIESASLSHRTGNASMGGTCIPDANLMIETVDRFYAAKFAHLVGQLESIQEGDGTLLDNTAAVYFQEMSDGSAHNLNNLPIIQAGSCGGYFKTGQAVNVDDGDPNLTRGHSSEPCAPGGPGEIAFDQILSTGTPAEFANAPINKYYCNLMNAIGVKAGSDGFPQVGGTEQVTHYGMYDRTEDFFGGGSNPPLISNPGPFEDLLA